MICGHHVITGKIQKLDKPYAVMKKQNNNIYPQDDIELMETDNENTSDIAYNVVAFVKQKIIFKNRPKPIIIKPQAKKI